MANNVLEQTRGQEICMISNQLVSRVIQTFIPFANPEHFERYLIACSENFNAICNTYTSHVVEKVIDVCFLRAVYYKKQAENDENEPVKKKKWEDPTLEKTYNMATKFEHSHREKCSEFIQKIGKFLLDNLEDFLYNKNANHIIRFCIFSLAGIHEFKDQFFINEDIHNHEAVVAVPDEWIAIVKEYVDKVQSRPQFPDFPYNIFSAKVLAHLLIALKTFDKSAFDHLGTKILIESFLKSGEDNNNKNITMVGNDNKEQKNEVADVEISKNDEVLPKVFSNTAAVRLLETMLVTAEGKLFTQIYLMLFMGRVSALALNGQTFFAVRKLIENMKEPTEFKPVFGELESSIETLLQVDHTGIVESLARTCLRLSTKQGPFVSALLSALHISGSKEKFNLLIKCILMLKPYAVAIQSNLIILHQDGPLILQHMLQFNKANKLAQFILKLPVNNLVRIFSITEGYLVAKAFIQSETITDKSRKKLLKHLKGKYSSIASTKVGCMLIEKLFEIANEARKAKIRKELAQISNSLQATFHGKLLIQSLHIDTYGLSLAQMNGAISKSKRAGTQKNGVISKSKKTDAISQSKKIGTRKKAAILKRKKLRFC